MTDGTPREQIDEGETRRVLGGGDEGRSFARASPASKCVSPFCVGKPTRSTCARWYGKKTYRPSDNANALAALMVILTSSNARAETRARASPYAFASPRGCDSHAKTKKPHPRSVSLSPSLPFPIIRPDRVIDRVIDPSSSLHPSSSSSSSSRVSLAHPPPRVSPRSPPPARAHLSRTSQTWRRCEWERTFARA